MVPVLPLIFIWILFPPWSNYSPNSFGIARQKECPRLRVSSMSSECGPKAVLRVDWLDRKPEGRVRFKWWVRSGEIESGQGSETITVKGIETIGEVSGTVEAGDLGDGCTPVKKFVITCCIDGAPPPPPPSPAAAHAAQQRHAPDPPQRGFHARGARAAKARAGG